MRTPTRLLARAFTAAAARLRRADTPVLILGGARSGKSVHAERLLAGYPAVRYVAPGLPPDDADPEWAARVAAHRARRPVHWHTVETTDLADAIRTADTPVLVDCLATWTARVLDELGAWDERDGWREHWDSRVAELLSAVDGARVPVVAVSNEVGSGIVPATASGRLFRDVLGALNTRVAGHCGRVLLVVAGRTLELPGGAR